MIINNCLIICILNIMTKIEKQNIICLYIHILNLFFIKKIYLFMLFKISYQTILLK